MPSFTLNEPTLLQNPRLHLNLPYAFKSERALRLHLIEPATSKGHYPLIIFSAGTNFTNDDLSHYFYPLMQLAQQGFVIALVEVRPKDVAPFPAQTSDLLSASRYLLGHAYQYQIDPYRYFLWGHGASASYSSLLASLTATNQAFNDEDCRMQALNYQACICFGLTSLKPTSSYFANQSADLFSYWGKRDLKDNLYIQVGSEADNLFLNLGLLAHPSQKESLVYYTPAKKALDDSFFSPYIINIVQNFLKQKVKKK